ncbi:MAG: peptidoglycan DD-metalloendopeptidase family protein [Azonexus sp.]|jgi:lipoprotein NlpD|nr:peptidoglycan DD-metalloendopeptidase family protein [Azonexus sp.]
MNRIYPLLLSGVVVLLAGCFSQPPAPAVDRSSTEARSAAQPQLTGPGYYTVKRGDTLYRIAMDHGQDYRDIAGWNFITDPNSIKEGQVLRVVPPAPAASENSGAVVASPVGVSGVETRPLNAPPAAAAPDNGLKREPRVGKEPYSDEAYARLSRPADASPPGESKPPAAAPTAPIAAAAAAAASGPDDVPWLWPAAGKVAAAFGEAGNKGVDIVGKAGDPVIAAGDGKVVYAGNSLPGYGELVIVKHNATFLSAYAHNRKILVKEGQQVSRGQKIAEMGNTGSSADSIKLHFEIRKQGNPVDPALYLPKR